VNWASGGTPMGGVFRWPEGRERSTARGGPAQVGCLPGVSSSAAAPGVRRDQQEGPSSIKEQ